MPWPIYPSRYAPGAPDSTDLWTDVIGQVQTLSNISGSVQDAGGSPLAVNGSFEADTNGTNPPTGWISTASGNVTNTNQDHGFQSYVVTQNTNGSGAGYLQSANFMNVSERMAYRLQWEFMTSQTNVFHQAQVLWYDHNTNLLGNTNVFTQSGGFTPNIWTEYGFQVTPQASAVLAKLQFTLGSVGVLPASQASLYLDNISTILRPPYSNVASFSNTNVWHVPNGTFRIWVKAVGGGGGGATAGGYCEGFADVYPGQLISVNVGGPGQPTTVMALVATQPTALLNMTAQPGGSTTPSSGGALNIAGSYCSVLGCVGAGNSSGMVLIYY